MPHAQSSPRGLFAKKQINLNDSTGNVTQVKANSTGVVLDRGITLNGARSIRANSTGFGFTAQAAKPSTRTAGFRWTYIQNSTGVAGIGINTTGTTWKYVNVTSVLPT
jgi:hypothetical protein